MNDNPAAPPTDAEHFLLLARSAVEGAHDADWFFGLIQNAVDIGIPGHEIPTAVLAWSWQDTDWYDIEGDPEDEAQWKRFENWRHPNQN